MRWSHPTAPFVVMLVALGAFVTGVVVYTAQVEVRAAGLDAARTCGSPLDALTDRAGWESWWAADLDEADPDTRSSLLRTTECPDAVNRRTLASGIMFGAAVIAGVGAWLLHRSGSDQPAKLAEDGLPRRVRRIGKATMATGAILTAAGIAAIAILLADADSTLFLYTDRFVVGVIGLIVLVPTISLIVLGRVLAILGERLPADQATGDVAS